MLLGQTTEVIEGAARVLENRSESTLLFVVLVALVAGIYWLQYRDASVKSERQDRRDQARDERDAKKSQQDSESLAQIAEGMQKCGDASQQFASISRSLEKTVEQHNADTKLAMLYAFRSLEHFINGNEQEAKQSVIAGKVLLENRRTN